MTGSAERTKLTCVRIIFGVTGCAVHGRTFELAVLMAVLTGNRGMFPVQMERELGMIHCCGLPAIGCMTGSAQGTKSAVMRIVFCMTRGAVHRRAFEDTIFMATLTGNRGMLPVKFERELRMIHLCQFPALGSVTGNAIRSKLTLVMIILCVTREAILRRAFEDAVLMATLTGNRGMFPVQMERELRVIHCCRFPSSRQMTGCAVGSKLTVVMVIFLVTGDTRLRSGFQVSQAARTCMTCRAFRKDMFPV